MTPRPSVQEAGNLVKSNSPPNVLILLTDQQRFDTLACYGNLQIPTPHLNRLAETSAVFEEAYCTTPVCAPSRGSLLTGLWPHQHEVVNNWELPMDDRHATLPQMLDKSSGRYAAHGYLGKWHLGYEIMERCGFTEIATLKKTGRKSPAGSSAPASYEEYTDQLGINLPHWQLPTEHSMPAFLINRAIDFIDRQAGKTKPWTLHVAFDQPHPPFRSCRDGMIDPDSLPVPANFLVPPASDQPRFLETKKQALLRKPIEGFDLKTESGWHELMASYWGNMANVDFHIGRLLGALERTGQLKNTLIIFTSDHGEMMGSHSLLHKAVMFQEAIRVPWLMRLPGQNSAVHLTGCVSQIDLVPTILDLCGAANPGLPGTSRAGDLRRAAEGKERQSVEHVIELSPVIVEWHTSRVNPDNKQACNLDARTLISPDNHRYTLYADGTEELYDLAGDPGELQNLAGRPEARQLVQELKGQLKVWREANGDVMPLPGMR